MDNVFDFLGKLEPLKNKINRVINDESSENSTSSEEKVKSVPFDPNKFHLYVAKPSQIPEDVIFQLADLFDGYGHFQQNESEQSIGPNTSDKIKDSLAVIYIVENDIPVAGATLIDPTKENYKGIIPNDYYALKSGISLENRVQQEFFLVSPEKGHMGLAKEIKKTIEQLTGKTFVIVVSTDTDTINGLSQNGYKFAAEFITDWEEKPVQLWIN